MTAKAFGLSPGPRDSQVTTMPLDGNLTLIWPDWRTLPAFFLVSTISGSRIFEEEAKMIKWLDNDKPLGLKTFASWADAVRGCLVVLSPKLPPPAGFPPVSPPRRIPGFVRQLFADENGPALDRAPEAVKKPEPSISESDAVLLGLSNLLALAKEKSKKEKRSKSKDN